VNFSPVQTFIAKKATQILSDKLKTTVSIDKVQIGFLNHVTLKGLYVEDKNKDTILYAGEASVRITDWFIFVDKPVIKYVGLKNTYAHLYRTATSADWNYQFIVDAFDSGPSKPKKEKKETQDFNIGLEKVELQNVRFHMDDAWVGSDMDFDIGNFVIKSDEIDFKKKVIHLDNIAAEELAMHMRDYDGGRPKKKKKPKGIDNTPFNPGGWSVKVGKLSLKNCAYSLDSEPEPPTPNEFDPSHIGVTAINLDANNIVVVNDTIRGKMDLSAKERSGLVVKRLKADVTVSPNASICDNLYLETNNSKLKRYYAMHYERFPDFKDYVNKVVMVGDFKDAYIDANDVGYFAPSVRQFKTILRANGYVAGSVDSLVGRNLNVNDGRMTVKGNVRMIGLPDINTTWIDYQQGEIFTNGQALLHYAPSLRNSPNLALEKVSHAYFKGNFVGYIDNFATSSILVTNLGSIQSDIKLNIPGMRQQNAVYAGTIKSDKFDLGALLKIADLGPITLDAKVTGSSFDPKIAKVNVNATVPQIEYRGYPYSNIYADGVLEKNKFDGKLLIDDPNLALGFYGNLDFSDTTPRINATANLLKSNFKNLKLTRDSLTATGDIDLNWRGTNIDNFLGYVRLYNINVIRNGHHLDLDSIYVNSTIGANNQKLVTIESNAVTASIQGNYKLSKLPNSVVYYLSGYLPNYIAPPTTFTHDQDINFNIVTRQVDSLLGVLVPSIRGFNDATVKGQLNTNQQQLRLEAWVPFGAIGNVTMRNVSVNGDGNFRVLALNAEAEKIAINDSIINGSVSVTTTLGNDSMLFNIATNSPNAYGTATINGRALAYGDSLRLTFMQSDFYVGADKWQIANGSDIIISGKYFNVSDLTLSSGNQTIKANSESLLAEAPINVQIDNVAIGELAKVGGLDNYDIDGRLNGNLRITNVLDKMKLSARIKANDVRFDRDTLGSITLIGDYDAAKNTIVLDPESGFFYKDASMTVSGKLVLFDSTSTQQVNGKINFNNAPLAWIGPLVAGYVSNISGTLNGNVSIGGSPAVPDVDGKVQLDNASVKVDFLGTQYDIHNATFTVNNNEIDFGNVSLFDVYKNRAILAGKITHDRFKNLRLGINVGSSKFQVINLQENENETFYGNLIVGFRNMSVTGPVDDIRIRISSARPADKSHLYLPIGGTSVTTNYSYVTFKSDAPTIDSSTLKRKNKNKLNITIDAILNTMAEITLVLDPTTGDAITATGTGNLNMEIPLGNDIRMYGVYEIEHGDYTFTLKQLFFKRKFDLNAGSRINFNGLIGQTEMNVEGTYTTRTRLYDLLSINERALIESDEREARETKAPQNVNVVLYMKGSLEEPKLTFKLDLPDKRAVGTLAYTKLETYNQDPNQLFNQVAALLLIGSFIPADAAGLNGGGATAGAISNISEILSGTASSQITNIVSKITGDKDLSVDLKYKTYNYYNVAQGNAAQAGNLRNEVTFGVTKNYFNNRLNIELGSAYDWGRPTANSSSTSNFIPVGDFRIQYQFREGGNVRGYIFRTSSYDVIVDKNLDRNGVGISWRKSFDNLEELFHGRAYARKKLEQEQKKLTQPSDTLTNSRTGGTW
jgi:Uncharacterized protein conserved in bacteria